MTHAALISYALLATIAAIFVGGFVVVERRLARKVCEPRCRGLHPGFVGRRMDGAS